MPAQAAYADASSQPTCTTGWSGMDFQELPGPWGARQSAPGCQRHHWVQSPRLTGPLVAVNTCDPGTSSAGSASGKSALSGAFSATVTCRVFLTNRANSALVTGCGSNQTSPTSSSRSGRSSG